MGEISTQASIYNDIFSFEDRGFVGLKIDDEEEVTKSAFTFVNVKLILNELQNSCIDVLLIFYVLHTRVVFIIIIIIPIFVNINTTMHAKQ